MINLPNIFEVIDVMHTSLGQFIRMYNATQTAKCMTLISKEVDALRCTISEVWCFCIITISSHLTTFTTGMRHTSIGLESMQKKSSPPSISFAIRLRISSCRLLTDLRRSLN